MNNEKQFFKDLASLEKVEYSAPLSDDEAWALYADVLHGNHKNQFIALVRRIENAHGIGIKDPRPIKS